MLNFLSQQLHADLVKGARWCVALSGGVDSTSLLHAVVQLGQQFPGNIIRAVHINHHLHADADTWAKVCQTLCDELGVSLTCRDVTVEKGGDDGLEAAARRARFGEFTGLLGEGEILLTAHHRDDQVETLLLRLLRGAGPHGLASIGPRRSCGKGWIVRPLLDAGRDDLQAYARKQHLQWIEDPANADTMFDRNFLRHRVLPVLRERWPGLGETIPRAARLSGEAAGMLDELAKQDTAGNKADDGLSVDLLRELPPARQRNVVRYYLRRHGLAPPAEARLRDGLDQLLNAGPDRKPLLEWGGVQIRRYRAQLYLLSFNPDSRALPGAHDWDGRGRLDLGPLRGSLQLLHRDEGGIELSGQWVIRFRSGGERLLTDGQHKTLKKYFQERGIVPWMRGHIPLLYKADCLIAVGDLWQSADSGVRVLWEGHPAVR